MAYVDPPIIVTILSKGLCSIWDSRPHQITPASVMVYLKTHPLLRPSHKLNPKSTSASMLTISCFFPSNITQETLFKTSIQEHIQVDVMGDVVFLLGTVFNWLQHKGGNISVHLCQSAFAKFTAHRFSVQSANKVPNMTPYRSGFPIDSIQNT